jgi:hypothetical protein
MQRDINPGGLANRAPRFSARIPATRIQLQPGLKPAAPPVYRPQSAPVAMQPMAANNRPSAPPVYRPQAPATAQTKAASQILQPASSGVIQGKKCKTCGANSHTTANCPHTATPTTPTVRQTAPSTLGTSHTRTTPSGNFVGHGAQSGAGGHGSGKRARTLRAMLANSQNK